MKLNDALYDDRHDPESDAGRMVLRFFNDRFVVLENPDGTLRFDKREDFEEYVEHGRYKPLDENVGTGLTTMNVEPNARAKLDQVDEQEPVDKEDPVNEDESVDQQEPVDEQEESAKEDLSVVENIGAKTCERLHEAGYSTIDDLQSADPDDLLDVSGVGQGVIDALHSNSVPLDELPGIGTGTAENLREAGYESPKDLRSANESDLLDVPGVGRGIISKNT